MVELAEAEAVRAEVRAWLAENWDPERPLLEWRRAAGRLGLGLPAWPRRAGTARPPPARPRGGRGVRPAGAVGTASAPA